MTVPLPLTPRNVVSGAGWTLLIFVAAVTWITMNIFVLSMIGSGFAALFMGLIAGGYALVISSVVGFVATAVLGIPLTLGISKLLGRSTSVLAHALGAGLAGALSGLVLVAAYLLTVADSEAMTADPGGWWGTSVFTLAVMAGTAASSAAGWLIAWRQHVGDENKARLRASLGEPY